MGRGTGDNLGGVGLGVGSPAGCWGRWEWGCRSFLTLVSALLLSCRGSLVLLDPSAPLAPLDFL